MVVVQSKMPVVWAGEVHLQRHLFHPQPRACPVAGFRVQVDQPVHQDRRTLLVRPEHLRAAVLQRRRAPRKVRDREVSPRGAMVLLVRLLQVTPVQALDLLRMRLVIVPVLQTNLIQKLHLLMMHFNQLKMSKQRIVIQ